MTNSTPREGRLRSLLQGEDFAGFAKFVLVGVSQNGVTYGVTLILIWLGCSAWQASVILYPIAVLVSFLVNRRWAFAKRKMDAGQLRKYVLVYVLMYFGTILFNWVQEREGISSWLASLITMAVAVGIIFGALNFWVFPKRAGNEAL